MPDAIARFKWPEKTLGALDADSAAQVIASAADVALVLDRHGVIEDLAVGMEDPIPEVHERWLGRPWIDTVTPDSRSKVEALLSDVTHHRAPRWREINHPSEGGLDLPVRYSAVKMGDTGRVLALGRDLRSVSDLQQKLIEAQQSMEREYSRLRQAEMRYRLLFQISSEAVMIVDAATLRIVEANPAADRHVGAVLKKVVGKPLSEVFAPASRDAVNGLLTSLRGGGRSEELPVEIRDDAGGFLLSASLFRQDRATYYLVRLAPRTAAPAAETGVPSRLMQVVENLPDGFVVTDPELNILTANMAFLELSQLATVEQVTGESLDRFVGRRGVELNVLTGTLKEQGSIRHFSTVLRGAYGSTEDVEISAVAAMAEPHPCYGFAIRATGGRVQRQTPIGGELPRSVEQLTKLVGRVSLREIVKETTDLIERLCIEAALELTGDNRASAAEMLGLSRQSLYAKLRRHNLGNLGHDGED